MKIERIDLKTPGAWVEFMDTADLTGKDYRRVQALVSRVEQGIGELTAAAMPLMAEILISAWEVPYLPLGGRQIPRSAPGLLDLLTYEDTRLLDEAVKPVVLRLMAGASLEDEDPKGLPQPGTESV